MKKSLLIKVLSIFVAIQIVTISAEENICTGDKLVDRVLQELKVTCEEMPSGGIVHIHQPPLMISEVKWNSATDAIELRLSMNDFKRWSEEDKKAFLAFTLARCLAQRAHRDELSKIKHELAQKCSKEARARGIAALGLAGGIFAYNRHGSLRNNLLFSCMGWGLIWLCPSWVSDCARRDLEKIIHDEAVQRIKDNLSAEEANRIIAVVLQYPIHYRN